MLQTEKQPTQLKNIEKMILRVQQQILTAIFGLVLSAVTHANEWIDGEIQHYQLRKYHEKTATDLTLVVTGWQGQCVDRQSNGS